MHNNLEPLNSLDELSDIEYRVTQEQGTEPPFNNRYWNNHQEGLYLDIISKEPLFHSKDKFDSGTGWPSFTQPINPYVIEEVEDFSHNMRRVEVRCRQSNSHLGHVFPDGPLPSGLRYCINSASLKFVAKKDLSPDLLNDYF